MTVQEFLNNLLSDNTYIEASILLKSYDDRAAVYKILKIVSSDNQRITNRIEFFISTVEEDSNLDVLQREIINWWYVEPSK
jgi:hypothetical protein